MREQFQVLNLKWFPFPPSLSDLLQGQLSELGQGAGQQADDERGRGADDVEHSGRQHGDVGVLPYEGIKQRHHCMTALGESTAGEDREISEKGRERGRKTQQ